MARWLILLKLCDYHSGKSESRRDFGPLSSLKASFSPHKSLTCIQTLEAFFSCCLISLAELRFRAHTTAASLSALSVFVNLFPPRTRPVTLRLCLPDEETPGLYGFLHVIVHSAKGFKESASKFFTCTVWPSILHATARTIHRTLRLITARLSTGWSHPETD